MKLPLVWVVWSLCVLPVCSQKLVPSTDDLRRNLEEASKTATLESAGTPAFRVEAKFDTFNYLGKPDGSGTVVEEWLSPGTQRRVVTFRGLVWTQVSHGGTVRISGSSFEGSFMERRVIEALLRPGPAAERLQLVTPSYKPLTAGTVALDCVVLAPMDVVEKSNAADKSPSAYCLSGNPRILRIVEERYALVLGYNHFSKLGEHLLAKDISISQGRVERAAIHVTSFRTAPELKEADFVLPSGPDSSAEDVTVSADVEAGSIVKKVTPQYPEDARQNHVAGTVTLAAIIDKMGSITHLEVLSAPTVSMAEASVGAVRQWKYKPYLLNGEPAEVDTTVTVNFTFQK